VVGALAISSAKAGRLSLKEERESRGARPLSPGAGVAAPQNSRII